MGLFRSLGYLGTPLLDGVGKPQLTLRYMMIATIAVPGSFALGAQLLGARLGLLSVPVAWAVGYPIAFAVLAYLVTKTIDLPIRAYLRGTWGIVGCCAVGLGAGFGVSLALPHAGDAVRLVAIGGASLVVTAALLASWQKITPRSIRASLG